MKEIDAINRKILDLLQDNGRMTNNELAEKIGLAPATTLERVKKLEKAGVITGYVATVDPESVDRGTLAFIAISLNGHTEEVVRGFQAAIVEIPEVLECYHLAGNDDYLVKVAMKDIRAYEELLLEKFTKIPFIAKIRTSFVLSTVKQQSKLLTDSGKEG